MLNLLKQCPAWKSLFGYGYRDCHLPLHYLFYYLRHNAVIVEKSLIPAFSRLTLQPTPQDRTRCTTRLLLWGSFRSNGEGVTDQKPEHLQHSKSRSYAAHTAEITFAREQVPSASFAINYVFRMSSCNEVCGRSFTEAFPQQRYNR